MDAAPVQPMLFNDPATDKPESLHDSARGTPEPLDAFHALVEDINGILGPSNGIDSADVDVEEIKNVMLAYQSNEQEWSKYAFADSSRAYTRNLVDRGNGKSNLLILVWTPGKASPIHDHANAHCIMKILKGSLTETIYGWPCQDSENPAECATAADSLYPSTKHTCQARGSATGPSELHVRKETTYEREQVTYMSDSLGLHRIRNPSESEYAISLHLYTPPNAAKFGCNIYDRKTGKSSHASQCHFYSELGQKME